MSDTIVEVKNKFMCGIATNAEYKVRACYVEWYKGEFSGTMRSSHWKGGRFKGGTWSDGLS